MLAVGLAAGVTAGCGGQAAVEEREAIPAIEITDGVDKDAPKTLALTPDAVRRLGLETETISDPSLIPFSAVIYNKKGESWVYTETVDNTFIRVPVTIDHVDGPTATVSAGPPAGTSVAVLSAIELYGAESGVGGGH